MGHCLKALNADTSSEEVLVISGKKGSWKIGRGERNQIEIGDPAVSMHHADLRFDGEKILIVDAQSRHGTFVNGERVESHELIPGDRIQIGKGEFILEEMEEAEEPVYRNGSDPGPDTKALQAEVSTLFETLELERRERSESERALRSQLDALQRELSEKNFDLSSLQSEIAEKTESNTGLEQSVTEWSAAYDQLQAQHDEVLSRLAEREDEILTAKENAQIAADHYTTVLTRLDQLSRAILEDWKPWLDPEAGDNPQESDEQDAGRLLDNLETAAERVRTELDKIKPHWEKYGDSVWRELKKQCDEVVQESKDAGSQLEILKEDLVEIREQVSEEVRRAQGLSRIGKEIEIPERFEKMIVAKDHEVEFFKALIIFLEEFETQIAKFRKSRSSDYRKVSEKMDNIRDRLVGLLEASDVKAFTIEEGTTLTPRHRNSVQVVSPEGWGGKKYAEVRFQPGEVVRIVRTGYEMGSGDFATILRKVEVVIRSEAEA